MNVFPGHINKSILKRFGFCFFFLSINALYNLNFLTFRLKTCKKWGADNRKKVVFESKAKFKENRIKFEGKPGPN